MSKVNRKIDKFLPKNIKTTLSYINNVLFPYRTDKISDEELSFILTNFVRSGKTFKEIKQDLIDVIDGKENEFSKFVDNYPKNEIDTREDIILLFMGIIISLTVLYAFVINNNFF